MFLVDLVVVSVFAAAKTQQFSRIFCPTAMTLKQETLAADAAWGAPIFAQKSG
jgi:predicted nucleotide-binding protein (sugar kinase/HSP70/actin superfamily)